MCDVDDDNCKHHVLLSYDETRFNKRDCLQSKVIK